jgi:hypothetical protein
VSVNTTVFAHWTFSASGVTISNAKYDTEISAGLNTLTGLTGNYTFEIISGALPGDMELGPDGTLSGKPGGATETPVSVTVLITDRDDVLAAYRGAGVSYFGFLPFATLLSGAAFLGLPLPLTFMPKVFECANNNGGKTAGYGGYGGLRQNPTWQGKYKPICLLPQE